MSRLPSYYVFSLGTKPGTKPQISLKDWMLPMFKKSQNLKALTVNLVLGLFKQCSRVQNFLLFGE